MNSRDALDQVTASSDKIEEEFSLSPQAIGNRIAAEQIPDTTETTYSDKNTNQTNDRTASDASAVPAFQRFSIRRILLLACGRVGEGIVSAGAFALSLFLLDAATPTLLFQGMSLLLVYRALYAISRGPERVLPTIHIRRRWTRVLSDEAKCVIAVLAFQYLAPLPIDRGVVTLFLITHLLTQFAHFLAIPRILSLVARFGKSQSTRRVLILGSGQKARDMADRLLDTQDLDSTVVGFIGGGAPRLWRYRDIPLLTEQSDIDRVLTSEPLDAVLFAASPSEYEPLQPLLERIELHGTPVFLSPELPTPRRGSVRPVWIADEPALLSRLTPIDRLTLFVKTLADRIAAAVMLILLLPLFICTAIAIRLDSKGPLFFQQIRVGRYGRLFPMYKFRSMVVDAEALKQALAAKNEMQGPAFKMTRDPRITRVGRFIRKFSIDELPQLFNVLLGDMSLVGPRPALPKEVAQYADWQRRRLTVKPGLTCIWQVSGRNSIPFEQWMELDLRYIDTWSLRLDAELLLRTVPTVIKGTGV